MQMKIEIKKKIRKTRQTKTNEKPYHSQCGNKSQIHLGDFFSFVVVFLFFLSFFRLILLIPLIRALWLSAEVNKRAKIVRVH